MGISQKLSFGVAIAAFSLSAAAADQAACSVYASAVEANLKEAALQKTLSVTARDPALAASSAQAAATTMQAVEQNVRSMAQSGCAPYPQPVDYSGYNTDAMRCAYEILQQRPTAAQCDKSTWTPKGLIETWHSFGKNPPRSD
ncbi:MAG TPA: hypothetical protein VGE51_14880 [Fontimonas sp.]